MANAIAHKNDNTKNYATVMQTRGAWPPKTIYKLDWQISTVLAYSCYFRIFFSILFLSLRTFNIFQWQLFSDLKQSLYAQRLLDTHN